MISNISSSQVTTITFNELFSHIEMAFHKSGNIAKFAILNLKGLTML